MSLPVRTPRGSKQSRPKPYGRGSHAAAGGAGTGSAGSGLFGAIRSVVTAPLAWFGGGGGDPVLEEAGEKRRHHSPPEQGSLPPTAKRARHHSPPPLQPVGDPPSSMFHAAPRSVLTPARSLVARSQSLALPQSNGRAGSRSAVALDRQMSVDAPGFGHSASFVRAAVSPVFVTRGQSLSQGQLRDASMGPPRSPSRLRATLTPQPSGATFGPLPPRKSRDPSAPPLLAGTIDSRRSPFKSAITRTTSTSNFATTPSLAPSLSMASSTSHTDLSQMPWNKKLTTSQSSDAPKHSAVAQLNAADIALQKLENYRTPLLPSRPNAPSPVLARLKPKKVHVPIPMPDALIDDWGKTSVRDKHKLDPKTARMVHPYSGESGLKRLLARQRDEGESTGRKEVAIATDPQPDSPPAPPAKKPLTAAEVSRKASVMDVDDDEAPKVQPLSSRAAKDASKPASAAAPRPPANQPGSSLRAAKALTKRTHVSSKNKFSAVTEDDDDALAGLPTEEELLAVKPVEFKIPQGFAFKPAVAKTDAMDTTASAATSNPFPPPTNGFPLPSPPKSAEPSPTPAAAPGPTPGSDFFATPPAGVDASKTPFPVPEASKGQSIPASIFSSSFASSHPVADAENPMDGGEHKAGTSTNGKTVPTFFSNIPSFTPAAPPSKPPEFGTSSTVPLFGVPAAEKKDEPTASASKPTFGAPTVTNSEPTKVGAFSFPPAPTPAAAAPAVDKPAFSFGALAPTAASADKKEEAPKPLFGGFTTPSSSTPPSAPALFTPLGDAAAKVPAAAAEAAKPPFTFGTPAPPAKQEAPKLKTPPHSDSGEMRMEESPERGPSTTSTNAFGAGGSSGFSFNATKPPISGFGAPATPTPFSFNPTPAATEAPKPPAASTVFNFGAPSTDASKPPAFAFGAPASDANKPATNVFAFGQQSESKPATPTGPPNFQFGATPSDATKAASPFAFGNSGDAAKPAASPFAFGAASTDKAASPFAAPPASTGFSFGGPKVDSAPREQSPFSAPASPFAAPAPNPFGAPAAAPAPTAGPSFSFAPPSGVNNPFAGAAAGGAAPGAAAAGFGFSIGAPDREKKPMPRRRTQPRR